MGRFYTQQRIWEITADCLNSHFIPLFLLTCICFRNGFFFSLWPFLPLGLHLCLHVSGCLEGLSRQRVVSGYRDVVSVESVRLGPMGTMDTFYWKQASGTPEWRSYTPLLYTVCMYVNLNVCFHSLYVGKRPVPFYYLLSHSPTLPLSVFNCLSMPYSSIVSLYLALLQPLRLKMRLSWLLWSFVRVTKRVKAISRR